MKRVHCLQHVPFEGLGMIRTWLSDRGYQLTRTRLYENESPPDADHFDWLIVLGGPMGVHDEDRYPWLRGEKELIGAALAADKGVIGICLGAQLVAECLGAPVTTGETEIGWLPLKASPEGMKHPLGRMLDGATVLHWHSDTFAIPEGAVPLACSEACPNQGYVYGDKVLGLQFHLEVTREDAQRMCRESHPGTVPSPWVQPPEDILGDPDRFPAINGMMKRVLEYMLVPDA